LALALSDSATTTGATSSRAWIKTIGDWENTAPAERYKWEYYDHWVSALEKVVDDHEVLDAPHSTTVGTRAPKTTTTTR